MHDIRMQMGEIQQIGSLYCSLAILPFFKDFFFALICHCPYFFSSIYARLLATYGRCHDRSSLFVLAENEPTVRKLFGTNVKKYFVVFTPPAYFQYVCPRWECGNMEMPKE